VGRLAFRRRWYVALVWAAVLAAVGLGALKAPGAADEEFSMPGIESQKAFDLMEQRFPGATADSATARVVFIAPGGEKVTAAGNRTSIEKAVAGLGDGSQVASAVDPFAAKTISEDGTTAFATVTYKVGANDLTDATRSHLERAVDQARDSGLTVEAGGTALAAEGGPGGTAEIIGVAIAAVVLLITFGSLAAAQALRAGASGFLGKDVTADTLLTGLRTVASGEALLSPVATRSLITRFLMAPASGTGLAPPERLADLTVREREVLALAAEGRSNTEIAEDLTVSPLTVRTHIHRAMTKLHARDRAQLVVIAYQTGLVRATPPA
jgi:DNA-binding NarL/FixJ family response regulator